MSVGWPSRKDSKKKLSSQHFLFHSSPQCKLAWEGNEAEYEDFYDYSGADGGAASGGEGGDGARPASSALAPTDAAPAAGDAPAALASYELALPSGAVLGSRHLARYYRQAVRPRDPRRSEAVRAALVEL